MSLQNGTKLPLQYRDISIVRDTVNEDGGGEEIRGMIDESNRTVSISFSSEAPVSRWFGEEILVHEKKAVRLQRLNSGAAVLVDHDGKDQVGVVDKAFIRDGRGYAVIRFGKSARANEIFEDVKDGIRSLVSVGYRIYKTEPSETKSGGDTVRVTDWEPYEVSICSIPADVSVGVGRAAEATAWPVEVRSIEQPMESQSQQPPKQPMSEQITIDTSHKAGTRTYGTYDAYLAEIRKTAEALNAGAGDLADALSRNIDPQTMAGEIFRKNPPAPVGNSTAAVIGMTNREKRSYSVLRLIRGLAEEKLDGFEKEVNEELLKKMDPARVRQMQPGAVFIPGDIFNRAATAGTATAGGYTVSEDLQATIPALRNKTALDKLGVTRMTGLRGNIVFPVLTSGTTTYWVSETGALTDSQPVWASKQMTPHRVGGTVPISTQLLAQSSESMESFIRNELITRIEIEIDRAGLLGTGADGEPIGVINAGIETFTVSATPTWAEIVSAESNIQSDNADSEGMAWLITPTTSAWLKATPKVTGTASFMLQDGNINGYRYVVSNQLSTNVALLGDWSQYVRGDWEGDEIVVDPYALKKSGQIEITINRMCDFLLKQTKAIVVSSADVYA